MQKVEFGRARTLVNVRVVQVAARLQPLVAAAATKVAYKSHAHSLMNVIAHGSFASRPLCRRHTASNERPQTCNNSPLLFVVLLEQLQLVS